MADDDRTHWDDRYTTVAQQAVEPAIPAHFGPFADLFASATSAVEIACGAGGFATWLAIKGVAVAGYDISPVAVSQATEFAASNDVGGRCVFTSVDLDDGLPAGDPVDLVVCNMFRDASLDEALVARLKPEGILAIAALSEVGAEPGRFRARPGELTDAFAQLTILGSDEADGLAWFVGRTAS